MKVKKILAFLCAMVFSAAISLTPTPSNAAERMTFGGGPAGGTFQIIANAIQVYDPIKKSGFDIKARSSAGSIENLRTVDSGKSDFGTVYSGHIYLGRKGRLKNDGKRYENVLALSRFYGAPAQLVVHADSGIRRTKDLIGKKVGVGPAGSGTFTNAEIFFTHLGIWNRIERNAMAVNEAAFALGNHQLDAFWIFTAVPSGAVMLAAQTNDIAMIDLNRDAEENHFYDHYPYFTKGAIPAGSYNGITSETPSFQDSAIWVANIEVPEETVYRLLSLIYTDEGLAHMANQKKTFRQMSIENGIEGIVTPLHPGAVRFWKEKGILE
uniref:TRAP transporter solute receptor, TAXI family n=1 Tax=Candidatus Kentrum sp. FW TaxID=2126338 RepID=A0A450SK32_9GAMM|nr:MAG: hypothetical protein BECKFW1821B_GA0114236_101618 [Candidatus Kentron sp. FW]